MNTPHSTISPEQRQLTIEFYLSHYLALFWRWKWYIGSCAPIVIAGWFFAAYKLGMTVRPEVEARTTVQFEESTRNDRIQGMREESRDAMIRSRSFLEGVADKLSLQVITLQNFRSEIFDSICVAPKAPTGRYDLRIARDSYALAFTDNRHKIKNRIIASGKLSELGGLAVPSVALRFTRDFLSEPHDESFFILTPRDAVDRILAKLAVKFLGEEGPIMVLSLKGRDYPLVTQIVNTIADDFVARNGDILRNRSTGTTQFFEKELQSARAQLSGAEEAIRQFREANPTVGTGSFSAPAFAEVSSLENSSATLKTALDEAMRLQERCKAGASADDRLLSISEAVTFLVSRQSVSAPALQSELNQVTVEKSRADADYSPQHPIAIGVRNRINRLTTNVIKALSDIIDKTQSEYASTGARKASLTEEFQKMPAKEGRYGELERKRLTASDVYSSALARYNENKVSETLQSGNAYIVDRAVVPRPQGKLIVFLQLLMIGSAMALAIGFGPPVGLDYFDKRARSEEDCRRFSSLTFLESIPKKRGAGGRGKEETGKINDHLVSASFAPAFFDETYRSLRAKILLHLQSEKDKQFAVTSLNAGEGKSIAAANLAIVMGQQKLRTLLIDGDLRRGVQHHSFVLEKKPGLSDILSASDDLSAIPVSSMIQKTHIQNLSLLSCGTPVPNPAEIMSLPRFGDLSAMLAEWFDMLILDTPPLRVAVDAVMLPETFKHYIFVVRAAKTNIIAAEKKIDEFPGFRRKILGIVLNGVAVNKAMRHDRYSYYRY